MTLSFSSFRIKKHLAGFFIFLIVFSVTSSALLVKPIPVQADLWGAGDLAQIAAEELHAQLWPILQDTIKIAALNGIYTTMSGLVSGSGAFPLFITDFDAWLVGNIDLGISTWLNQEWENGFALLCSGINPNIAVYLMSGYEAKSKYATPPCSLSDIQRSFQNKGYEWFDFTLSLQPNNSDVSYLFELQDKALEKATNDKAQAALEAITGNGFVSKDKNGKIKTPGSVIQSLFSKVTEAPIDVITASESITEAVSIAAFSGIWDGLLTRGLNYYNDVSNK